MELAPDLPPALVPVAWLLGTWQGAGVVGYPGVPESNFGQEVVFSHEGRPWLAYSSRSWRLDAEGGAGEVLEVESGYWRPQADGALEVVLSNPDGVAEVYVGEVSSAKVELSTDVVARTTTGVEHAAGHRLYGLVEGDLLWAYDRAAGGHPLQAYMSARLKRVP